MRKKKFVIIYFWNLVCAMIEYWNGMECTSRVTMTYVSASNLIYMHAVTIWMIDGFTHSRFIWYHFGNDRLIVYYMWMGRQRRQHGMELHMSIHQVNELSHKFTNSLFVMNGNLYTVKTGESIFVSGVCKSFYMPFQWPYIFILFCEHFDGSDT